MIDCFVVVGIDSDYDGSRAYWVYTRRVLLEFALFFKFVSR